MTWGNGCVAGTRKKEAVERLKTEGGYALFRRLGRLKKQLEYFILDDNGKNILWEFADIDRAETKLEQLTAKKKCRLPVLAGIIILMFFVSGTAQAELVMNRAKIDKLIEENCMKFNFEPYLAKDIAMAESRYRADARGTSGERGLFQIMPATWDWATEQLYGARLPFSEALDAKTNIEVGLWYLSWIRTYLMKRGHLSDAGIIASYNMGVGNLRKRNYEPPKTHKNKIYARYYSDYWKEK